MKILFLLIISVFISSCSSSNYYREASSSQPHAKVNFELQKGLNGSMLLGGAVTVFPLEINGLPPNEWNKWSFRTFKVNPGPVTMLLEAAISRRITASTYIKFVAVNGETYNISSLSQGKNQQFIVKDKSGKIITSSLATKAPVRNIPSYVPLYIPVPS